MRVAVEAVVWGAGVAVTALVDNDDRAGWDDGNGKDDDGAVCCESPF